MPNSGRYGTNVRKTQTPEAPKLLEPGELDKPTGTIGSGDLARVVAELAKLTL